MVGHLLSLIKLKFVFGSKFCVKPHFNLKGLSLKEEPLILQSLENHESQRRFREQNTQLGTQYVEGVFSPNTHHILQLIIYRHLYSLAVYWGMFTAQSQYGIVIE